MFVYSKLKDINLYKETKKRMSDYTDMMSEIIESCGVSQDDEMAQKFMKSYNDMVELVYLQAKKLDSMEDKLNMLLKKCV